MKRVKSLVFNTFNLQSDNDRIDIEFIAEQMYAVPYLESTGFGFSNLILEENVLSAKVLKRTSTFIQDYDNERSEIVRKQIFLYSDIQFYIDFNYHILYVLGGVSQINYVKSVFRNLFKFEYELNSIDLNASNFYDLISDKNIKATIEQLVINGFNYNNGIVGRFAGEITKQDVGAELINEYRTDIVKITFKLCFQEVDCIKIQVLPNGNIKMLVEEQEFEYYLAYIKSLIFS